MPTFSQFLTSALLVIVSCKGATQNATLAWKQDLSANANFAKRLMQNALLVQPPTIDFITDSEIVLSFDDGPRSHSFRNIQPGPHFHILGIDADGGGKNAELIFQPNESAAQAEVTAGGRFVVLVNQKLEIYSSSFEKLRAIPVGLLVPDCPSVSCNGSDSLKPSNYSRWQINSAPGGKELLVVHATSALESTLEWLETEQFTLIAHSSERTWKRVEAMSKGALLIDPLRVELQAQGNRRNVCQNCDAHVVTNDLLFIDKKNHFEIERVSGTPLASGKLDIYAPVVARSAVGNRIAYATGKYRGNGFPLLNHFTSVYVDVKVFDLTMMKEIASIRMEKRTSSESPGYSQLAIALSPDGNRLVILSDGILSCYRVR